MYSADADQAVRVMRDVASLRQESFRNRWSTVAAVVVVRPCLYFLSCLNNTPLPLIQLLNLYLPRRFNLRHLSYMQI